MSETLLAPSKKIYDAVHGFIRFNGIERALIDAPPFQRLHHIHQLGISYLVYPGATHSRFEHSLGTMQVASAIFDHLLNRQMELEDPLYWRQIVRLAALCHDLGHLPFSHDAEEEILGKKGHEQWTLRLILSAHLEPVWKLMESVYPGRPIAQDVADIALGTARKKRLNRNDLKNRFLAASALPHNFDSHSRLAYRQWSLAPNQNSEEPPCQNSDSSGHFGISEIITGDFFGADRIDYLVRDARCTGVSHGVFDYQQLIEMLCILPSGIGIEGGGIESCEALLLSRHFMNQRVYNYASVWGCKFHMRRFMRRFYEENDFLRSLESFLSVTDNEVLAAMRARTNDPDACALFKRECRFTPLPIDVAITEERIKEAQRRAGIGEEALFWHLAKKKGEGGVLSFPVLLSTGAIVDASEVAQVRIPQNKKSWLFIAPTVAKDALERLLHAL